MCACTITTFISIHSDAHLVSTRSNIEWIREEHLVLHFLLAYPISLNMTASPFDNVLCCSSRNRHCAMTNGGELCHHSPGGSLYLSSASSLHTQGSHRHRLLQCSHKHSSHAAWSSLVPWITDILFPCWGAWNYLHIADFVVVFCYASICSLLSTVLL